ncbi:MAG: FkbM family methyltransferase [Solirubrobacterales bacterium]
MKRLVATLLLASRVRPSLRFARRQRLAMPGVFEYRLRSSGRRIFIRHDSDDAYVLAECFGRLSQYDPPPEAAELLARDPPRVVVDLGANIGLFGLLALQRWPGCELVGFEPDPANAALAERCIEANGLAASWRLKRAFAATAPGRVSFAAGRSARSRAANAEDSDTIEVEAVDAFAELERADLIKIDIEGGEWPLLADPRLASLRARIIVLEYHRAGCPGDDPRAAAVAGLEGAGYRVATPPQRDGGEADEGRGVGWAWRE